MSLSEDKQRLLNTDENILALGGPGSGKTYIALKKAEREIEKGILLDGQRLLFLSFARATIARIAQQANVVVKDGASALEISTYHGFTWNVLRSHGYLLRSGTRIELLPPPEAASRLADFPMNAREAEKRRLFAEEGLLHFDLFAPLAADILEKSNALLKVFCGAYPIIILDEFQDTNADEWRLIQTLGKYSRLIALADADQRIYEFRGADPKRIGEFIAKFRPAEFDFGTENNRSNGTDIARYGNDLLSGANTKKAYANVSITRYQFRRPPGHHLVVKTSILKSLERISAAGKQRDWSIAVLVPTKRLMLDVSTYLSEEQTFGGRKFKAITHEVALETTGPALSGVAIAGLLEGGSDHAACAQRFINDLCSHMRGRQSEVARGDLQLALALGGYVSTGTIRGPKRQNVVNECIRISQERLRMEVSGDPAQDWLRIRQLLLDSSAEVLVRIGNDARYLRLLHKGATLRGKLGEIWRTNGNYSGAGEAVRAALVQEHFSASTRVQTGIQVMTIHKSKGKEFDEVIVYEGSHQGRIIRQGSTEMEVEQARLALRVAVTRARSHATIITPASAPCSFL